MATVLYIRDAATSGISGYKDLSTTAGSSNTTGVVDTTSGGTNIQWTKTAGGTALAWISKPLASGVTISGTITVSLWAQESATQANAKGRCRIYKYSSSTETEFTGSPFDDDLAELPTSMTENTWTGTASGNNVFSAGDRIVVKFFITNNGTMGSGRTCTMNYDAAAAATGDSFVQFNENLTFAEPLTQTLGDSFDGSGGTKLADASLLWQSYLPSDTLSLSDDKNLLLRGFNASADSLTITDEISVNLGTVTLNLPITVNDTLTLSDDLGKFSALFATFPDSFTLTEESTQLLRHFIDKNDTLTLTDGLTTFSANSLSIDDFLSLSDGIEKFSALLATQSDSLTLTDAIETFGSLANEQGDQLTLSDSVLTSLDVVAQIVPLSVLASEDLNSFSDEVSLFSLLNLEKGDLLVLGDSIDGFYNEGVRVADSFTLSDSAVWGGNISIPLEVEVGDYYLLSDYSKTKKGSDDLAYLRRYLDDVH